MPHVGLILMDLSDGSVVNNCHCKRPTILLYAAALNMSVKQTNELIYHSHPQISALAQLSLMNALNMNSSHSYIQCSHYQPT